MRPLRLELAGFTSFRDATVIEFEGADHFVLMGPTGAGKSSIIDAMTFALYGSVPRYENRNLVAPVITQGRNEAKVRLDFSVEGKEYTAVRVVKRTGGAGKGASTKEARLESAGETLAGTADEVTDAVADLIGLSFEHFCKCVVLPQGEFSRFLHDKPADRQDMLVRLLNLGVYEVMRQHAAARASQTKTRIAMIEERLSAEAETASPERLEAAEARRDKLEALRGEVTEALPGLASLSDAVDAARAEASELGGWVERLAELAAPEGLDDLGAEAAEAQAALAEAKSALAAATQVHDKAVAAFEKLPERDPLLAVARARNDVAVLKEQAAELRREVSEAAAALREAETASEAAEAVVAEAEAALAEVEHDHAAHALAADLVPGEPCPVCAQVVKTVPRRAKPAALKKAEAAVDKATAAWEKLLDKTEMARTALLRKEAEVASLKARIADGTAGLKGAPTAAQVAKQLAALDDAEAEIKTLRATEREARATVDRASSRLEELRAAERSGRMSFEQQRDALAPLEPPAAGHESLAADWADLLAWAGRQIPALTEKGHEATRRAESKGAELEDALAGLAAACEACGLQVSQPARLAETVVEAATKAAAEVEAIRKAIEAAAAQRKQLDELGRAHAVASSLAQHLSAKGFERWIVNEALRRLVEGATVILKELSNDQYSLAIDDAGNFLVTDHHNANETRSARTLSGGETFLASLALALSLSDQLVELAAEGSARLEAIFLDEGFGTLDPETLDTVAATVENLAAGGRMVGIVTHVRDLAERVPLQFRVRKEHGASTVERVAS